MPTDRFSQNLQKLFSQLKPPPLEAVESTVLSPVSEVAALRRRIADLETQLTDAHAQARLKAESARTSQAQSDGADNRHEAAPLYEHDQIGYVFTGEEVEPFMVSGASPAGISPAVEAPLRVAGQSAGALWIDSSPARIWTPEEKLFAEEVAHRLSLQVENLRLLSAAQRAQASAEAANRRFVREGWENYLDAIQRGEQVGFAYDQTSVSAYQGTLVSPVSSQTLLEPVTLAGEPIGTLCVDPASDRVFSADEHALVNGVARQLAQQVENLRLLADAARARADAETVTRRLTRQSWQDYTGQRPTQDSAFVYDQHQVIPLDTSIAGDAPAFVQPLTVRGETIGSLAVAETGPLSAADAALVAAAAARLSAHIETLRLLEENEHSQQQLQKRAAELQAVARVTSTASTELDAGRLLATVVDLARDAFDFYHAQIYLLDEAGQNFVLAAGAGEAGRQMLADGRRIPSNHPQALVARAARAGQGLVENDVCASPAYEADPFLPETRSELAAPMIVSNRVVGVLNVQSNIVGRYGDEDVQIQSTLATQVAVALQNARLYSEQAGLATRLREVDRLKSTFLANMSHELRTPLNSVIGYTDVILEGLDGPLTEPMTADLHTIQRNGQHLLSLINDVLDMAKIESGKLSLSIRPFNLREVLTEIMETTLPLARGKNIDLRLETAQPSLSMEGDDLRLRQVVMNLVNNAIKFTDHGGWVALQAEQVADRIRVQVRDNGIGIPADKLELIFQEFMQVDSSTTRKVGGTGLGLPISRHLVTLHGGKLWAESSGTPGEGSTLIFEVPVAGRLKQ